MCTCVCRCDYSARTRRGGHATNVASFSTQHLLQSVRPQPPSGSAESQRSRRRRGVLVSACSGGAACVGVRLQTGDGPAVHRREQMRHVTPPHLHAPSDWRTDTEYRRTANTPRRCHWPSSGAETHDGTTHIPAPSAPRAPQTRCAPRAPCRRPASQRRHPCLQKACAACAAGHLQK